MSASTPPTDATPESSVGDHADRRRTDASTTRLTGITAIVGAVIMLIGAAFYYATGSAADLPPALHDGTIPAYLDAVNGSATIVTNLSLWIVGATLMGAAGVGFALLGRQRTGLAGFGATAAVLGAATAIVCFMAWLAVVVAPAGDALLGETLGWFAWHLDHVATALIIGFGPMLYALAGKGSWVPTWLVRWGAVAGVAAVLSLVAAYVHALADIGMVIVPVGIGWMIAGGITAVRQAARLPAKRA